MHFPATLPLQGFSQEFDIVLKHTAAYNVATMDNAELDQLRAAYTGAIDKWVAAIREEEALATADHSVHAWDLWEKAGFAAEEARKQVVAAKKGYEDGLREANYGILTTDR